MAKTPDKLTMPSQVSGHCLVDKNGDIYQMVADSDEVWHAFGQNADSIGIEHVARPGEQLMPAQEQATAHLCRWLLAEYKIPKEQITGHSLRRITAPGLTVPTRYLVPKPRRPLESGWISISIEKVW
jgi:N-acetyl-anhydromuramyl-L-alanine amidase AmpD